MVDFTLVAEMISDAKKCFLIYKDFFFVTQVFFFQETFCYCEKKNLVLRKQCLRQEKIVLPIYEEKNS